MTKRRGRTRESPHVLVFRVFYEAARNLDSQPPLRTDHVEACRPRGYVQTIVSAGTGLPNTGARSGPRPDVRAALARLLGRDPKAHEHREHLTAEAQREDGLEGRRDDQQPDQDVGR